MFVRKLVIAAQDDGQALLVGQGEGWRHRSCVAFPVATCSGRGFYLPNRVDPGRAIRPNCPSRLRVGEGKQKVARDRRRCSLKNQIPQNGEDPRLELCRRAIGARRPIDTDENLLRQILRPRPDRPASWRSFRRPRPDASQSGRAKPSSSPRAIRTISALSCVSESPAAYARQIVVSRPVLHCYRKYRNESLRPAQTSSVAIVIVLSAFSIAFTSEANRTKCPALPMSLKTPPTFWPAQGQPRAIDHRTAFSGGLQGAVVQSRLQTLHQ